MISTAITASVSASNVILPVVIAIVFAFICASMARKRNRHPLLWGFLGFVGALITVIVLALLGNKAKND